MSVPVGAMFPCLTRQLPVGAVQVGPRDGPLRAWPLGHAKKKYAIRVRGMQARDASTQSVQQSDGGRRAGRVGAGLRECFLVGRIPP